MKKVSFRLMMIALVTLFNLNMAEAAKRDPKTETSSVVNAPAPEVQLMIDRVYEIKDMDRSNLTMAEKKELKKELKALKHDLKKSDVIVIPVGAAIIVLLLLILLL